MRLTFTVLALSIPAWSQTATLKQFLGLTDTQATTILQHNGDYNTFSSQQQQQIFNAQGQISREKANDRLDPIALGTLYAGIESACRELKDRAASAQQQNLAVLTDAQRAKLIALNDAMKLSPAIDEAQGWNLMGSIGSPPSALVSDPSSGVNSTSSFVGGTVSGCSGPGNGLAGTFVFGRIPPPLALVREYLGLSDDQVTRVLRNNNDYNDFTSQQQRQISQAQSQIFAETAKDPLNPIAIGTLYAGIESACREVRDRVGSSQRQNIAILNENQKTKLNALNEAMKLVPTISDAQSGNLLDSPTGSSPPSFTGYAVGIAGFLSRFSSLPGCS